ncbi:MAG: transcription repressor NadR [Eubacterium sp.]|nr:transcription repressor NadR [Eubacterium sp.]
MNGEERRTEIVNLLHASSKPLSGDAIAREMNVSRQVIVQDIALLRANGIEILSTNRGYLIQGSSGYCRVFKVIHGDDEVADELSAIVSLGGRIKDVFVYHKIYGVMRATLNIRSQQDIDNYMKELSGGKSSLLKNVTSGYHYHTVEADSERLLDLIQEELQRKRYLAKLQDYEPVKFNKD